MSNWLHVAGVIRIDAIRFKNDDESDFDKLIGKECLWKSSEKVWIDANKNPDSYLPMGSEGSLQKSVWINPNLSHINAYIVTIFGDLRDRGNIDEIIEWFKRICKKIETDEMYIGVRQAVITVDNECGVVKTYTN